ncbi:MAG: DNA polymerase III subunit beta [Alphaproteobacteria bacterium]
MMEFTAKKDDLLGILGHVQSVVERRVAIPVLANVKVSASNSGEIEMIATDMDICIQDKISGEVKEAGVTTIPAGTLYEIVRKIPENADVHFKQDKSTDAILITVNSSEFNLPTISAEEFPSFEDISNTMKFKISSEILRLLLDKTRHAISNEETRYYLNGVYLHAHNAEDSSPLLRAVATDGHRLARAQTVLPEGCENMPGIIIPKKTVAEVIKLLDSYVGEVQVALAPNKIIFAIGSSVITSKLIDGKFPDYERVIPKNNDKTLEISRNNLSKSIDLVISISSDKTRAVKFKIENKKVEISASSEINGNAKGQQEIDAKFDGNEPIVIGFNSRYVLDSLSAIDSDNVMITFSSGLGAAIAADANDNNFIYILMPMQV